MLKATAIVLGFIFGTCGAVQGQNYLNGPESVAFDTLRNQYLVSSLLNNKIVSIDTNGVQSEWLNLTVSPYGNCILGDTLYFTSGRRVYGYDIGTKALVMDTTGVNFYSLDGITADTSGHLYVVSTSGGRIFKINLIDLTSSTFVTGLTINVQDVYFDERHNRLLIGTFAANHAIQAVDLPGSSVYNLIQPGPGFNDGVSMDNYGNLYVGSYNSGTIVMWDTNYTNPGIVISSGHIGPSGIDYNRRDDVLAVPNFDADTVVFVRCNYSRLGLMGQVVDDPAGDMDGHSEPGESSEILVTIRNDRWTGEAVTGTLTTSDPYVTITQGEVSFGDCPGWGAQKTALGPFQFEVDGSCPDPHIIQFELELVDLKGDGSSDTLLVFSGNQVGFADGMEGTPQAWTHASWTDGYVDEWHVSDFRSWTGDSSWKIGGMSGADYSSSTDAALITPPFLLPNRPEMTFWYWIDTPTGPNPAYAYDGGIVMIGTQDGNWIQITPLGGYHHSIVSTNDSPFEIGTECYAGSFSWRFATFDLSAYSGVVQIAFRFGSDIVTEAEGWYLDDILVEYGGCCTDPTGDVDGNNAIEITDLTYLVAFFFDGGPAPKCAEEADLDSDTQTNIADLTYLVGYLFGDGPAPNNCL